MGTVATGLGTSRSAQRVVGLLDIGASKTVCLIAALPRPGRHAREAIVLGAGVQASRGVRDSLIVELDEAEHVVRAAVAQAERAAGVRVDDVLLSVSGDLGARRFTARTRIEGHVVTGDDIARMLRGGRTYAERDGRALLHLACISYGLDHARGISDPMGLAGEELNADLHVVTTGDAPLRNLLQVVERAYLTPSAVVPAPYAGALAATSAAERDEGVLSIDMGAGSASLAIFARGQLVGLDRVPFGGLHVTAALAHALQAPAFEAERIKRDCGTVVRIAGGGEEQAVSYVQAGTQTATATPAVLASSTQAQVVEILRESTAQLLGRIAQTMVRWEVQGRAPHVVLSGGASGQHGMEDLASEVFARPVRVARMQAVEGLPVELSGPGFAASVGLVSAALDPTAGRNRRSAPAPGYLGQVRHWLRESF